MNEVENEDLVFTLETIVDKFGEEMAPYAFGLCQNLVMLFLCDLPRKMYYLLVSHVHELHLVLSGCCILEVYEYG